MPSATALSLEGRVSATRLYLEGDLRVDSPTLITNMGGTVNAFRSAPQFTLTADRIVMQKDFYSLLGIDPWAYVVDPTKTDTGTVTFERAQVQVDRWLGQDGQILVATGGDYGTGVGQFAGTVPEPTPVTSEPGRQFLIRHKLYEDAVSSELLSTLGQEPKGTYVIPLAPTTFNFTGQDFAQRVTYEGSFVVYLYGADYSIGTRDRTSHYETGVRDDMPPLGFMSAQWYNRSVLKVEGGRLQLESETDVVAAYSDAVHVVGPGSTLLADATGQLETEDASIYNLRLDDASFSGALDLRLTVEPGGGFQVSVSGEYTEVSFAVPASIGGGLGTGWWLLGGAGALGLVGVGGAQLLLHQRQRTTPPPTAVPRTRAVAQRSSTDTVEPTRFQPIRDSELVEVPEAFHLQPGFSWSDLSRDFGVVKAGEAEGVFLVLVPETRVEGFCRAAAGRGFMAEDTADRIEDRGKSYAVVVLEPSPLSLN